MTRTPVTSSSIKSLGYDADTKTLHVEFQSGRVYAHLNVSPEHHAALLAAESIGQHYNRSIRGKFEYSQIEAPQESTTDE